MATLGPKQQQQQGPVLPAAGGQPMIQGTTMPNVGGGGAGGIQPPYIPNQPRDNTSDQLMGFGLGQLGTWQEQAFQTRMQQQQFQNTLEANRQADELAQKRDAENRAHQENMASDLYAAQSQQARARFEHETNLIDINALHAKETAKYEAEIKEGSADRERQKQIQGDAVNNFMGMWSKWQNDSMSMADLMASQHIATIEARAKAGYPIDADAENATIGNIYKTALGDPRENLSAFDRFQAWAGVTPEADELMGKRVSRTRAELESLTGPSMPVSQGGMGPAGDLSDELMRLGPAGRAAALRMQVLGTTVGLAVRNAKDSYEKGRIVEGFQVGLLQLQLKHEKMIKSMSEALVPVTGIPIGAGAEAYLKEGKVPFAPVNSHAFSVLQKVASNPNVAPVDIVTDVVSKTLGPLEPVGQSGKLTQDVLRAAYSTDPADDIDPSVKAVTGAAIAQAARALRTQFGLMVTAQGIEMDSSWSQRMVGAAPLRWESLTPADQTLMRTNVSAALAHLEHMGQKFSYSLEQEKESAELAGKILGVLTKDSSPEQVRELRSLMESVRSAQPVEINPDKIQAALPGMQAQLDRFKRQSIPPVPLPPEPTGSEVPIELGQRDATKPVRSGGQYDERRGGIPTALAR